MAAQHQDILVFNAYTGEWQNASAAGPSGAPLGGVIGAPDGSSVGMIPGVDSTIAVDLLGTATIASAFQMSSGAASESVPAYSCAIVFNQGEVNEQLGQLTVSGLNDVDAQAVLMTSQSVDGTIPGSTLVGTLAPGMTTTYEFTTQHATRPNVSKHQYYGGVGIYATDHDTGTNSAEGWVTLAGVGYANGFSTGGSSNENGAMFRWSPLHDGVIFFRGCIKTPSSGNVNNTTIANVNSSTPGYLPTNNCRLPVMCVTTPGSSGGYLVLEQNGALVFQGVADINSGIFDVTGTMHPS